MNPVVAIVPSGPATRDDLVRLEKALLAAITELREVKCIADKHVLSTGQAMEFVNCNSRTALCNWVKKFAPFARVAQNRYSRARLEIGRAREINGVKEGAK